MDTQKAFEILAALADGTDPATGEIFPVYSPYRNPQVVGALVVACEALQARIVAAERSSALPDSAGKAWSVAEEQLLIQGYERGATESELAKVHQRTKGSIRSRLMRLGKIELK